MKRKGREGNKSGGGSREKVIKKEQNEQTKSNEETNGR